MHHHALGEQSLEGLLHVHMAGFLHRAGEEARIEKMQDRVLDAANILIDRQPAIGDLWIGRLIFPGCGKAGEVPAGIDEGIHRVGFAPRIVTALRAGDMTPCRMTIERVAWHIESDVIGQLDRQVLLGNGNDAADFTMDDRDRAAPIALSRNAPVTQAEINLALGLRRIAQNLLRQLRYDGLESVRGLHAVEEAGIDHHAVIDIGGITNGEACRIAIFRHDDRNDGQTIFAGKVQVALVARRATEDRAGAIIHQHEVCDVDRQFPGQIQRMDDLDAGIHATLLCRFQRSQRRALTTALVAELGNLGILLSQSFRQGMIGGNRQEGSAKQRVRTRRVNRDVVKTFRRRCGHCLPAQRQAFRLADPVLLHQPDLFRPLIQLVQRVQQILAEIGDAEEPLRQLALLDQRAGAPAATVNHLLIGQNRMIDRVPVDLGLLAIDQALLHEVDEQRLLTVVVIHVAGRKFAAPVQRQSHGLQLATHGGDVLVGPVLRVNLVLHGSVFRRHAKGIPTHGMQHIIAARALVAGNHIAHRVVAHMAHMNATGWVREHLKDVIFLAAVAIVCDEDLVFVPLLLPARLGVARIITFDGHTSEIRVSRG